MTKTQQIDFLKAFIALNDSFYNTDLMNESLKDETGNLEVAIVDLLRKFTDQNGLSFQCAEELLFEIEHSDWYELDN
jgi:hypothetical protein